LYVVGDRDAEEAAARVFERWDGLGCRDVEEMSWRGQEVEMRLVCNL